MIKIGVLALQGNFALHAQRLHELAVEPLLVRKPAELKTCAGLILPGGESTTLVKLLDEMNLFEEIRAFNRRAPIFGTCAGAILLSKSVKNHPVKTFGLLDARIERNSYGRQVDSFEDEFEVILDGEPQKSRAVFIRAPRFLSTGRDVTVLARYREDVILVENKSVLAATFHPELTADPTIHRYFLEKVRRFT